MQGPGTFTNITAQTVIVSGPTGSPVGVFVYAVGTTPAAGNPPTEWISNQLTDPYGNALPALARIGSLAGGLFAALDAGFAQFGTFPAGTTGPATIGYNGAAGGDLAFTSGTQDGADTSAIMDLRSAHSTGNVPRLYLTRARLLAVNGGAFNAPDATTVPLVASAFLAGADIAQLNDSGGLTQVQVTNDGRVNLGKKLTITAGGLLVAGGTVTDQLHATAGSTLDGPVTVNSAETITAGGLAVTGGTVTDTLHATSTTTLDGAVTVNAKETITAGGLAVTGGTTTDTLTVNGTSTLNGEVTITPQKVSGAPVIKSVDTTVSGPVTGTTNASLSKSWNITAPDALTTTSYGLRAGGYGVQGSTAQSLRVQLTFMGVNVGSDTIPSTSIPANTSFEWMYDGTAVIVTTGATGTARSHGVFTLWQVGGPLSLAVVIGQHTGIADSVVDTTTTHSMGFGASWGSVTGAPTITGAWSQFERAGA